MMIFELHRLYTVIETWIAGATLSIFVEFWVAIESLLRNRLPPQNFRSSRNVVICSFLLSELN